MDTLSKLTILAIFLGASGASKADAAETQIPEQVVVNFQQADANGDRSLTFAEFTRLIDLNAHHGIGRAALIQRRGAYQMAFGRIDADGNGVVTTDEMQAMAARAAR